MSRKTDVRHLDVAVAGQAGGVKPILTSDSKGTRCSRSLRLAKELALPAPEAAAEQPRYGTTTRWKGKQLLTKAEKLERQRVRARKWRARNRQKMREYFREYRAAHPEIKVSQSAYYREHREKWIAREKSEAAKAWRRRHRKQNAAKLNAARREWNRKNPDRAKEIERRTREKNREKKRLADREYRRLNPETYKNSIARAKAAKQELYKQISVKSALARRARRKQIPVERVSLEGICARDRDRCHLCGVHVDRPVRTFDHLIPIVRGGAHAEWNLMVAHDRCNKSRGTKQILPEETKQAAEAYIAARIADRGSAA